MATSDHRRHKRYEVRDIHGFLLFRVQVEVKNISLAGIAVETTQQLKLGRVYSLHLSNQDGGLDVQGTIRWCHLSKTRAISETESVAVYEAGIAFEDVLTEKATSLVHFLEQHVVVPLEKRIIGRFRMESLGPVDLESRYKFEVLKLSISGMLLRTQIEPSVGSAFGMEITLRGGPVPVSGRVAYVNRVGGTLQEPIAELGVEFVDVGEATRLAVTEFISNELE
jgi:hypothetical protein